MQATNQRHQLYLVDGLWWSINMPSFTFTSPEGKKYTVNGPEGATKEQAFEILQKQLSQNQNVETQKAIRIRFGVESSQPKSDRTQTDFYERQAKEMPFMQQVAAGAGGAAKGTILGLKQLFGMDVPESDVQEYQQAMAGLRGTGGGVTGEVLGTLAQFVPAGAGVFRAAGALPKVGGALGKLATTAGGRAALSAAGGAAQGAVIPVAEDENRLANIAGGAILAGGASRLIDAATAKVAARNAKNMLAVATKSNDPDAIKISARKAKNILAAATKSNDQDAIIEAQNAIAQASKNLTPQTAEELARLKTLRELPVPITEKDVIRSQITRQYPQQEAERLIAGQPIVGNEVAARLGRGQEKMAANIEAIASKTGAKAPTDEAAGETIRSWMQNIYGEAKKETQDAYNYAKSLHGEKKYIPEQSIVDTLVENRAMPGYKELFAQAQNMGIIVKKKGGGFTGGRVTVNDLDKFKSIANKTATSSDGMTRFAGGDIVNKVYGQLDNVAPEFKKAAALRKIQGAKFEDPKITKKILGTVEGRFGEAEKQLGDITIPNYQVPSEKLVNAVMGGSVEDVRYIRNLATSGNKEQRAQGVQALREIRGAVIDDMKNVWEKTQTPLAKANQIDKYFDKLGDEKIRLVFGKAGAKKIADFRKAAAIMNRAVPSPEGGSQTAGRLMNIANQTIGLLERLPVVGSTAAKAAKITKDIRTASAATKIPSASAEIQKAATANALQELISNPNINALRSSAAYSALPLWQQTNY
jgi:hypothetical protein